MHPKFSNIFLTISILFPVLSSGLLPIGGGGGPPKVVLRAQGGTKILTSTAQNYPDLSTVNFDNVARSACVHGTWIFYGSKNYYGTATEGVEAYSSNSNACFAFRQNLSEKVSSMRYTGSAKNIREDFLNLFSGIFFTGFQLRTSIARSNIPGDTKSIIVTGSSPWTLFSGEGFTGKWRCVFPQPGQLPRFYRKPFDIGDIMPKSVKKGCRQARLNRRG